MSRVPARYLGQRANETLRYNTGFFPRSSPYALPIAAPSVVVSLAAIQAFIASFVAGVSSSYK